MKNKQQNQEKGSGKTRICYSRIKESLGHILNKVGTPGFIKPIKLHDDLTSQDVEIRLGKFFTIISINGRDYYFHRLNGKFDGTGMCVACKDHPIR